MKAKILIIVAIFSLTLLTHGQINLGKIKSKIKNSKENNTEKEKETQKSKTSNNKPQNKGSGNLNSEAVMLDKLLLDRSSFNFGYSNGNLRLGPLRAMNLPTSIDKTRDFKIAYKNASGATLATFSGYAQAPNRKRSWLIGNIIGENQKSKDFLFKEEGNYYLEFSVSGQAFDRFYFSVKKHTDPEGSVRYLKNGGWNDLAFFEYDPRDRRPQITFNVFMRDLMEGTGVRPAITGKYKVKIVRDKDNKIIAWHNKEERIQLGPIRLWNRSPMTFFDAEKPEQLKIEKILAQDGNYHVEFLYEGKLYGKYPFSVSGGKLQGLTQYKGEKIGSDGTVFFMQKQN